MDKHTYKILKFYNAHPDETYSISTVAKWFPKLSSRDLIEISKLLEKEGYLRLIQGNLYQSTNKGKTYIYVNRKNWFIKNLTAILALIVSVIALIISILK